MDRIFNFVHILYVYLYKQIAASLLHLPVIISYLFHKTYFNMHFINIVTIYFVCCNMWLCFYGCILAKCSCRSCSSVVEMSACDPETLGLIPSFACYMLLCPWARHFTELAYWCWPEEQMVQNGSLTSVRLPAACFHQFVWMWEWINNRIIKRFEGLKKRYINAVYYYYLCCQK